MGKKKEQRRLAEREAALAAELAEREAKAAKKAGKKKSKKPKPILETIDRHVVTEAAADVENSVTPQSIIASADRILTAKGSSKGAIAAATAAKKKAEAALLGVTVPSDDDTDAEIKARVSAKRLRRDAPAALEALDRSDAEAVAAYNDTYGKATGSYATSTAEQDASDKRVKGVTPLQTTPPVVIEKGPTPVELVVEHATEAVAELESAVDQVVEEVETEKGRVFEAGTSDAAAESEPAAFAVPSDAKPEVELNGLGQYKVQGADGKLKGYTRVTTYIKLNGLGQYKVQGADGKLKGYTRVTTYIKLIEDKTNLEKWSKRKLLEGVILDQTPGEDGEIVDRLGTIRDLMHNRDVAIAKARKADRKGKLAVGELATLVAAAEKTFKDGVNGLIVELEELGGSKEAANKGTELHALAELYDKEGIDAVAELLTEGKITPADLADIEAYGRAIEASGIKHVEYEKFVVDDERKVAGRLDRISLVKFPGMKRAVRVVSDIKTGSIDYGISLSLQLENYAGMQGYDPERPDEREDLKLSRTKGVVIHLPQGTGTCHIYAVDLVTGRLGNRITAEGRAFRNTGKRAIDKSVDLADPAAVAAFNARVEAGE